MAALQERLEAFYRDRDWRRFQTLKDLAASTSVEVGELQQLFLWRDDEQSVLQERHHDVTGELADILINLMNFAQIAGVDLIDACVWKLNELEERYPAIEVRSRVVAKGTRK